jgi:uncharacterized integral membrane protein
VKAALVVLVLSVAASAHITFGAFGWSCTVPVAVLVAAAEALAAVAGCWLAVRVIREARPCRCPAWVSGGAW